MSLEIIRKTKKLINKKHKEWGEPVPYPELEEEFNIMDYAGIGKAKVNIPDDIKIKEIKLNDKQYLEERFGITGEENEKK